MFKWQIGYNERWIGYANELETMRVSSQQRCERESKELRINRKRKSQVSGKIVEHSRDENHDSI